MKIKLLILATTLVGLVFAQDPIYTACKKDASGNWQSFRGMQMTVAQYKNTSLPINDIVLCTPSVSTIVTTNIVQKNPQLWGLEQIGESMAVQYGCDITYSVFQNQTILTNYVQQQINTLLAITPVTTTVTNIDTSNVLTNEDGSTVTLTNTTIITSQSDISSLVASNISAINKSHMDTFTMLTTYQALVAMGSKFDWQIGAYTNIISTVMTNWVPINIDN